MSERDSARRFVASLSRSELFQLGDDLVLGCFDWREWFNTKPSAEFMNELDRQRQYAEECSDA
jgi:hypothetical protein